MRLGIDDETLGLAKGAEIAFPCRMITCRVQSSLSAVGMMARITKELADEGLSCNVASAFFHDYLFVPEDDADLAMDVLLDMVDEEREKAGLEPLDEEYDPEEDDDDDDEDDEDDDDDDDDDDNNEDDDEDNSNDKQANEGGKDGADGDETEGDETEGIRKQMQKASVEDEE